MLNLSLRQWRINVIKDIKYLSLMAILYRYKTILQDLFKRLCYSNLPTTNQAYFRGQTPDTYAKIEKPIF